MTDKLLTIVIPTYNMELYLKRCLESLLIKEDLLKKVEVFVINDGSKDHSSEIAHNYEKMYPASFRVIDKENGNYGSCVNRGLAEANGKYFRLLDADDWFNTSNFEKYVSYLENCDTDVVLTDYSQQYENKQVVFDFPEYKDSLVYNIDDLIDSENKFCMHALTYRLDLLRDVGLKHQEGISYTDIEYCYFPITRAERLTYYSLNLYQYFIGRDGQTISNESYKKNYIALYKVVNRVTSDYLSLVNISARRKKILSDIILFPLYRVYLLALVYGKEDISFKDLEKKVMKDKSLLELTNKSSYRKIPFVYIWRKFGIKSLWLRYF